MRAVKIIIQINVVILFGLCFQSCLQKDKAKTFFEALGKDRTGLDFSNNLVYMPNFNLFKYMYFYNGSGVGAGDFNNDGKIDLFFGSNQGQNKLFLNTGELKFKDVTVQAKIPVDGGWTTGISVVDINNDGLLDIYVCRVGQYETLHSKNQLLVNQGIDENGIPQFNNKAAEYGLDFSGFSTQAAFFDYDNDDDPDIFLLNHSVHQNNNFRPRSVFEGTYDSLSGDRIYRNEGQKFVDVTRETGIYSTAISYGLGVVISDINLDGYPDLYIGNDFHENDYLYINQKNGTFKEESTQQLMHTSQYSMGVDVADINNDAFPEIISMDMLPSDPYILKRSLGEDAYDLFQEKLSMGYSYQLTRNNLQYNKRNGMFSEIGLYSGVAATDWSWAPLWMDFDNDGWKDLFISNGIPKRMNDIDYVNFVTSGEVQQKINNDDMQGKDLSLLKKFPEIKLPNKFYKNNRDLSFTDLEENVNNNSPSFSNGAAYADLDNDGDLDIVVNNIDNAVVLYENKHVKASGKYVQFALKGPDKNINAIGAKIILFDNGTIKTYENFPVKGFLSSMQTPLHVGLEGAGVDSAFVVWPDGTYQHIAISNNTQTISYQKGLPTFNFAILKEYFKNKTFPAYDITDETGLTFLHNENRFIEFDREPLIPHMLSTEAPCLAVADINGDGLEDVFVGASRDRKSAVFLQQPGAKFLKTFQPVLDADSIYETTDACWADVNSDGNLDLVVASGGNEFYGMDVHNTPRIYLNDGKASFTKLQAPFSNLYLTASTVAPYDFNGDGYVDLFIGARTVPWGYGEVPQSYLFKNNKNGTFSDVTHLFAKELSHVGFVTQAVWFDLDKDNDMDLLVSLHWGGITSFINDNGKFTRKVLVDKKGWWNFMLPFDADGDGDIDIIAGNLGLNSRLKASEARPVKLYFNDFDGNGEKEQVLTYFVGNKEISFANKSELEKQMPILKKKFLFAENLAKASLDQLFGKENLANATVQYADYFANALLINNGNLRFECKALPPEAQLTSYKDAIGVHANNDSLPDVLLGGNFYENNIEMGRYDADFGTVLINMGKGNFSPSNLNGVNIKGQVRRIKNIKIGKKDAYILARNSDSLKVIQF